MTDIRTRARLTRSPSPLPISCSQQASCQATKLPKRLNLELTHFAGTRRRSSANQFSTIFTWVDGVVSCAVRITRFVPASSVMSECWSLTAQLRESVSLQRKSLAPDVLHAVCLQILRAPVFDKLRH